MRKIRVLVAKPGLDGHDRGAKIIARGLRDAGFEVIYTGLRRTPAEIAETALQEDVDVIALSIMTGTHLFHTSRVIEELKKRGVELNKDVVIIVGGIIPDEDVPKLKEMGVAGVFGPGTFLADVVETIKKVVPKKGGE